MFVLYITLIYIQGPERRARRVANVFVVTSGHAFLRGGDFTRLGWICTQENIFYQRARARVCACVGSEPFAIYQIYDIIVLMDSTFSFFAKLGVKDRI